jgi:GNAT superfamily N-acetyltransferase
MRNSYYDLAFGATADLMPGPDGLWLLSRIAVQKRNQGAGSRLMAQVIADADAECADIMLSVQPDPGTDRARLRAWYAKLGFEQYQSDDPDVLVRYHDQSEEAQAIRKALREWEAAAFFAYTDAAKAKPLYVSARFILAGDELAKQLKSLLDRRKPGKPATAFEVGDEL